MKESVFARIRSLWARPAIKRATRIINGMIAMVYLLAGMIVLSEWVTVGIIANPNELKNYPWGAEGLSWNYASPRIYATSAFIFGTWMMFVAVIIGRAAISPKARAWPGYLLLAAMSLTAAPPMSTVVQFLIGK